MTPVLNPAPGSSAIGQTSTENGWLDRAREAVDLATVRPQEADRLGAEVDQAARATRDWAAVSVALRARGVAAMQLRHLDRAGSRLRAAIAAAARVPDPGLVGQARMSLASVLVLRGVPEQAFATIELALTELNAPLAARARVQRAAILQELGRLDEALEDIRAALPVLRRAGDVQWENRALSNRGLMLSGRRQFAAAQTDLLHAQELCRANGLTLAGAYVEQNLGCLYAARGEIPAALTSFDVAEDAYRSMGLEVGSLLIDRATVLLSVRLIAEARAAAEAAAGIFAAQRRHVHLPEARLILSTAALLDGDIEVADRAARSAVAGFRRLGRTEWQALAKFAVLQAAVAARVADGPGPGEGRRIRSSLAADLRDTSTQLAVAGWPVPALEARLLAGRIAMADGQIAQARSDLAATARARRWGPADARVKAWLGEALLRDADGDRRGARSALRAGLRVVTERRQTLGASELRAHISAHRGALARAGLRMAIRDADVRAAHWWAEAGRATAEQPRPALPPPDAELARLLEDLRATLSEIATADGAQRSTAGRIAHQVVLERAIRDHSRAADPDGRRAASTPSLAQLRDPLGEVALLELIELDHALYAVVQVAGRARLIELGASDRVREALRYLPLSMRMLATPGVRPIQAMNARQSLLADAAALDDLLIVPVRRLLDERPLLVIPGGWLQSVPWSLLPSCVGRPVTIAPSAAVWLTARRRQPRPGKVVCLAGPGLPGAAHEAVAVAAVHDDRSVTVLSGEEATSTRLVAELAGTEILHLAAHGTARKDNPLFSALQLADGPFTVYDLERSGDTPRHVIMAACGTAMSYVTAGEEILGLAAAWLAQQTATLIAPIVAIPDLETAPLMISYHRLVAAGVAPATALAQAQLQHRDTSPASLVSAASFVCLGSGEGAG